VVQDTVLTKPDAPMLRSGSAICSWGEFMVVLDDLREDDSDLYKTIAARQRKLSRLASLALDEYEDSSNVSATVDKDEDEDEHGFSAAERRVAVLEAELAVALAMKPNSKKSLNYTKAIAALSTTLLGLPVGNVRDLRHDYWSEDTSNLRSLQTVLRRTKQHSVTDPRDKIHGLLGMMSDSSLNVDYNKSVSQVYCEATTLAALESPPALFVDMMYSRPVLGISGRFGSQPPSWTLDLVYTHRNWAHHLSDDIYFGLWTDTGIPTGIVFRDPSVHCNPESLELRVSASTVDLVNQIIQCSDDLIAEALSDDPALQLVKYPAKTQEFFESYTKAASVWNTRAYDGLLGIIRQLPNMDTTLTQEECADKYAALISANEDEAVSVYEESELLSSLLYEVFIMKSPNRMSFFVTEQDLCGLCMPGAQVGDTASVLFHGNPDYPNVPFITRPRDDGRYSMLCTLGAVWCVHSSCNYSIGD
jgi:hypothetical protein